MPWPHSFIDRAPAARPILNNKLGLGHSFRASLHGLLLRAHDLPGGTQHLPPTSLSPDLGLGRNRAFGVHELLGLHKD